MPKIRTTISAKVMTRLWIRLVMEAAMKPPIVQ